MTTTHPIRTHSTEPVLLTVEHSVATIQLNRPPLNAIDTSLRESLLATVRRLADDPTVHACVIHGGNTNFAAGADIEELRDMEYLDIVEWNSRLQQTFTALAMLPFPVIAAVNGYALGGGLELALTADIRIGAKNCTVGLPEITLGIMPGAGGTQRLTQIVGRSTAKHLIFTGRHVDADEAQHLGLFDWIEDPDDVANAAHELASVLAAAPRYAIRAIKEAVDAALPITAAALALERSHLSGTFAAPERTIAMTAFLDHRAKRREGSPR